jgi:hypothetical protein
LQEFFDADLAASKTLQRTWCGGGRSMAKHTAEEAEKTRRFTRKGMMIEVGVQGEIGSADAHSVRSTPTTRTRKTEVIADDHSRIQM